ncbi:MAG: cytochrome C oxidase subunit IV family protein [Candidatus Omnitrophota bacterium]|nr:cytochrome C oxidase subunit IV family protein [Candidatus Omnitrophota bacterium]
MSEHSTRPGYAPYVIIWAWLIALLAGGTFVSTLPVGKTGVVLLILGIALIKTLLVGMFYMHLKSERSVPLWGVVLFPFLLVGAVVLLIAPAIFLFA